MHSVAAIQVQLRDQASILSLNFNRPLINLTRYSTRHSTYAYLTLWRPLLPYGYSYELASCDRPG